MNLHFTLLLGRGTSQQINRCVYFLALCNKAHGYVSLKLKTKLILVKRHPGSVQQEERKDKERRMEEECMSRLGFGV